MSLLAPLYVLGALAVAAPIVFHLIRRSPRGEVPFSSLMFLSATPPRVTRRSRLDDVFLLLLRAAALCLLAFAFARPFLREAAALDSGDTDRQKVVVLVDTSASLRRGDLWARAKELADEAIAAARPGDQLAVFAFDRSSQPVLGFAESATLDPARREAVARARLDRLAPSWGGTDLGQALIDAIGSFDELADASETAGRMPKRVVLISDLQQGSRLDALGLFEWPADVELELKTVADEGSNAGLQRLADDSETRPEAAGDVLRVRVSNDAASRRERFKLAWVDGKDVAKGKPVEAYVPPGQSRVVRVPEPPAGSSQLRLTGDSHAFDNTLFVVDAREDEATVVYVGDDAADDPGGLLYYLERVFQDSLARAVRVRAIAPDARLDLESDTSIPLVVLSAATNAENLERLQQFARDGGTVLCVLASAEQAGLLQTLAGLNVEAVEAPVDGDVMLGEIEFGHPLFVPLSGPQYNDFTKIRFWKYRRLDEASLGEASVLARFENGDPAVVEHLEGKGRIVVLTSGWGPADSQLARSSKFVPLMSALLAGRNARPFDATALVVGDAVPVPSGEDATATFAVQKPDGTRIKTKPGDETFSATDRPGVYTIDTSDGPQRFAVNVDPAESETAPLPVETLERFGCRLAGGEASQEAEAERQRQMLNAELEGRQKLWRWLILAAVGVLIVETWLAGRIARPRAAPEVAA